MTDDRARAAHRAPRRLAGAVLAICALLAAGCSSQAGPRVSRSSAAASVGAATGASSATPTRTAPARPVPRWAHVVVVILENHAPGEVLTSRAPFLEQLAARGTVLTQSHGVAHPSQPNYLALFSGSTQGVGDDSCPHTFTAPTLAGELQAAGLSFTGYSEGLPAAGYTGCSAGGYARKHAPWVDFPAVPSADNQPMSAFPTDPARLPTVSFVVPDLTHDMHNGTVSQADSWLRDHLGAYSSWAAGHGSLLIVTADEDDDAHGNRIPTLLVGAHVATGTDSERVDHYGMLATLLHAYGLPPIGRSATAAPIAHAWK